MPLEAQWQDVVVRWLFFELFLDPGGWRCGLGLALV